MNPTRSFQYDPPTSIANNILTKVSLLILETVGKGKRTYPNKSYFDNSFTVIERA